MIIFYAKTGCGFCAKVRMTLDAYGLSYEERNIADPKILAELMHHGGKKQTPYIVDGEVALYESDPIIAYIQKTYSEQVTPHVPNVRLHQTSEGGVCAVQE